MFPIPTPLTPAQWWWVAIAIGMAAMSAQYGERARQKFLPIEISEKIEKDPTLSKYSIRRAKIKFLIAMLVYTISLLMVAMVSPR